MEFIIRNIVERMKAMQEKGNEVFSTDVESVTLGKEKHNETGRQMRNDCC